MPKIPLPPAESMHLDSLAEVARGGMGSVELARALDGRLAGQILAVKRLHPNIAEDPEFVSMFLDEAWVTAALKHPNVAQVMAWGNDDKGMFLAIELVQGVSLSRLFKEAQLNQEAFAERTVAFICSQICAGLVAAHTLAAPDGSPLGIVHRDLTPANVLISFDGTVKIIDFGIAKAEERISHTRTGQLKGKPAYMAPEQQRGGAVDARADLFAFGVTMFEMLAGRRPWTSKGAFDVMMEISNDPHPDLGELRKGLNPEFVSIAHKCLEKKPEDRIQTAVEIKRRLDGWLAAKGFSADDQHSLAQFVLRNSQPQVLWWQEALRGEHAKKKAPTFKELEEKIDEERERKAKAAKKAAQAPARPAAGTQPMSAFRQTGGFDGSKPLVGPGAGPDSSAVPSSAPRSPQTPSSGDPRRQSLMGIGPSSLSTPGQAQAPPPSQPNPQSFGAAQGAPPSQPNPQAFGSGQYQAVQPQKPYGSGQYQAVAPQSYAHPGQAAMGSGQYAAVAQPQPPPASKPLAHAGTEFMAISPFAAAAAPAPDSVTVQRPPREADPRTTTARSAGPPSSAQLPQPRAPVAVTLADTPFESGTIPMQPGLPIAAMTQPMPPGGMPVSGASHAAAIRQTGANFGPQVAQALAQQQPPASQPSPVLGAMPVAPAPAPASAPAKKGSRVGLVLFVLVVLLGGSGAGLYFFGDRIGVHLPHLGR